MSHDWQVLLFKYTAQGVHKADELKQKQYERRKQRRGEQRMDKTQLQVGHHFLNQISILFSKKHNMLTFFLKKKTALGETGRNKKQRLRGCA